MATIKKAVNGSTVDPQETLPQKNARMRKEMNAREKRIETNQKEKEKNSYSNTRANQVVGKKMKNGGSLTGLKASNKRVGPVDPKGAFTKVQKKTLAGARGKAKLVKDKQLGATKMSKKEIIMAIVKKPIKKVPKAQVGRLIDKLVSKESNRLLDRVVKRPAGMTDKAVDYGKVVLTDAQKAKNAEILKNPGSATADSWARAKKVAKKETDAKWKGILEFNKPMTRPPGSPQTSTLARIARSIKATAKKAAPKSKNGSSIKKAQNGTKVGGPTYVNLKIKNPKAKDSADYKKGYDAVKSGKKTYFPNRATSEGINEGLGRLNKGVKAKAKTGTSLGMKSVKAGFDKNPGVTRADIITAAKGKAQNGKKLIKSGVKGMSENEKLKKGITRLAPVNKTMKSGGKMTKCKYGCN